MPANPKIYLSEARPTPQSPALGALASALRKAQQFAGRYQVLPQVPLIGGTSVDELLSLPGAASLLEDVSYHGPSALIKGGNVATGGIGTYRIDPRVLDVAEVAANVSPLGALATRSAKAGTLAAGRAGERLAERIVPQIMERGGAGAEALAALAGKTPGPTVIAWHGTPHRFERFDLSKIGSGEGAQAYGHGLYFAESPSVARSYADQVKNLGAIKDINQELSRLAKIMSADEIGYRNYRTEAGKQAAAQYDALMAQRDAIRTAPGQMYKVDIPDEAVAKFLDWDKPLSEQHPDVQAAFEKLGIDKSVFPHWSGQQAYEGEVRALTDVDALAKGKAREKYSETLRQAGIPGIKYLDEGSRAAGEGTRNYVLFSEDLPRILEVNEKPTGAVPWEPGEWEKLLERNEMQTPDNYAHGGIVGLHNKYEKGGRIKAGTGLPDPTLLNFQMYADTASRDMFPDEKENSQRDAARHMLASAIAAQKLSPAIAEFLGKAHEFKSAPLRTAGYYLGISDPRSDYFTDTHNNALGVEIGGKAKTLRELLDAVEEAARSGAPTRQQGRASLEPDTSTGYAEGGAVIGAAGPMQYDENKIQAMADALLANQYE